MCNMQDTEKHAYSTAVNTITCTVIQIIVIQMQSSVWDLNFLIICVHPGCLSRPQKHIFSDRGWEITKKSRKRKCEVGQTEVVGRTEKRIHRIWKDNVQWSKKERGRADWSVKKEEVVHWMKRNEVCVRLTYKGDWKVISHMAGATQGE